MNLNPKSIEEFVLLACKSKTSISAQMGDVGRLIGLLKDAIPRERPDLDATKWFSYVMGGLVVCCPRCGQLTENAVAMLGMAGTDIMSKAIFGGPNVAALGQGRCPKCSGSAANITFTPPKQTTAPSEPVEPSQIEQASPQRRPFNDDATPPPLPAQLRPNPLHPPSNSKSSGYGALSFVFAMILPFWFTLSLICESIPPLRNFSFLLLVFLSGWKTLLLLATLPAIGLVFTILSNKTQKDRGAVDGLTKTGSFFSAIEFGVLIVWAIWHFKND